MADFRVELDDAVADLDRHYGELKQAAAPSGSARCTTRPTTPRRSSASSTSPGTSPRRAARLPGALSPGLYEQERARVAARFEEAVRLAEQAFLEEFARLVGPPDRADHRHQRRRPAQGLPRLGRRQPVEFFERFRDAERPLQRPARRAGRPRPSGPSAGVGAQDLRDSAALRQRVAAQLVAGPVVARRAAGRPAAAADPPAGAPGREAS